MAKIRSELFSEQLVEALCTSNLLGTGRRVPSECIWSWVGPYIEQRLRERRTKGLPRLYTIQRIAERLAAEEGVESDYETYALKLLQLVAPSGERVMRLFTQHHGAEDFRYMLLVSAAFTNHTRLVADLADPDQSWGDDRPLGHPFEAAVMAGNYEVLTILFDRMKCSARVLKIAINNGDLQMVKYMLNLEFTSVDPWQNWRPQHENRRKMSRSEQSSVLKTPSVEIFEMIRSELRSRQLAIPDKALLRDLLANAAGNGHTDMVKHLVLCGAPVDEAAERWPPRALWCACAKGHEEVVQVLLQNGAKPRAPDFRIAATSGHLLTLKLLLESEAAAQPHLTTGCLYAAAKKGFADVVQLLLDHGVDPKNSDTAPLIGAVESEHTTMFRMLVQRGAVSCQISREQAEAEGLESMSALLQEVESSLLVPTSSA